jgi:hypothetical protein
MKALRAFLVVGLVGCGGGSSQVVRPTRVDHARTPMNATYADAYGYTAAFASARYAVPAYAQAFAQTCSTSSDCGTGEFACRSREDGVRVCMGYGSRGESCWFDADCVSGSCGDTDGHKTCR